MSTLSDPAFTEMSAAEAGRFMLGNRHPIREAVAAKALPIALAAGDRVLDLGCGRGIRIKDLYPPTGYWGLDQSPALIDIARRDNPGYLFGAHDIVEWLRLWSSKSLPVGIMVSVLEHVPSLEIAQAIYREARRVCVELFVGWHTPPYFDVTECRQVRAELDRPIWQNRYAKGTFDGAVAIQSVAHAELWTVRD